MSETTMDPGDKSAKEIEREVDAARNDLSASVDALQNRFSVETIVDTVMQSVSKNGGDVSRNLGRTLRDNPLPVILTGVGLAWLIAGSNQPSQPRPGYPDDRDIDRSGDRIPTDPVQPDRGSVDAPALTAQRDYGPGPSEGLASRDPATGGASLSASPSFGDRARGALDSVKDGAGGLGRDARDRMDRTRHGALGAGTDMADKADRFFRDQPLIVGALGFAVGLGIGGLLPRSDTEDDLLGSRSDALKASAADMASQQADKAKAVAGAVRDEAVNMADEAAGEVDRNTPAGSDIVDQATTRAKTAADRLKDAGTDAAAKQDRDTGNG